MKREKGSEVILIGEEWGDEEEEEKKKERNGRVEECNSIEWVSILRSVFSLIIVRTAV